MRDLNKLLNVCVLIPSGPPSPLSGSSPWFPSLFVLFQDAQHVSAGTEVKESHCPCGLP